MRELFIQVRGKRYRSSRHRSLYETTAAKFNVTPELVYMLAHGINAIHRVDYRICRDLYYSTTADK